MRGRTCRGRVRRERDLGDENDGDDLGEDEFSAAENGEDDLFEDEFGADEFCENDFFECDL